jgi:hypothetical protein
MESSQQEENKINLFCFLSLKEKVPKADEATTRIRKEYAK